ncbi:MAG TPA: citryl-CoA lyase [Candidatus Nanoarchaeia archaeon]
MTEKNWKSAITGHFEGVSHVRGYKLTEMLKKLSFTQAIFLVLKGELPNKKEETMLNAILVASIDHGMEAPSTTTARITASCGVPLSTAVANGVAAIGDSHGGAIDKAAKIFQEVVEKDKSGTEIVEKARFKGERVPGYGHRVYATDPRTVALLEVAEKTGFKGKYIQVALEIEKELEKAVGKKLCLNIDGVTAALISEMGFDWRLGKGFFIIGRIAGLVAHVYEEQTREKPVRRISEEDVEYDGPKPRKLPK